MSLVAIGDPRVFGTVEVQYVGDKSHAHEGGHQVAVDGREVYVLPDGHTTARNRSHAITRVLTDSEPGLHRLETVIGALVLAGATNIIVDGEPLLRDTTPALSLKLDVDTTGVLSVTSLGGVV